jgi:hypothetical protein
VPRSTTGTPLSRRPLGAAALFAAPAAVAVLLGGCSAGQISQTDNMVSAVPGGSADSPHKVVSVRDVTIRYDGPTGYAVGKTAPLVVYIVNNSESNAVMLRGVTATDRRDGTSLGTVTLAGGKADVEANPARSASASAAPGASASASGGAPATPPAGAPGSATPSTSPSAGASASASAGPNAALNLRIPANSYVRLAPEFGAYLTITGLTSALGPGSSAYLTFNVAGDDPFGTTIPFGIPSGAPSRLNPTGTPAGE